MMIVRVPVEQPQLWKKVAECIEELARFSSADSWKLEFTPIRRRCEKATQAEEFKASVVALFSGGLDSLCGAAYLAQEGAVPVFVSHSPPGREHNFELIRNVWQKFNRGQLSSDRLVSFRLELRERDKNGVRCMFQEPTRRTRPFFFLSLACAVALDKQIPDVQMSENGAFGMSLPLRADAYGAQCSRQAHIHLLSGFAEILNLLSPRPGGWKIHNPFEEKTKGEACLLLQKASCLAKETISCEYVGRQAAFLRNWIAHHPVASASMQGGPQCGICTPCLIRRAALHKAGIEDPSDIYFFDARRVLKKKSDEPALYFPESQRHLPPLFRAVVPQVFFMRRFCQAVRSMSEFDFVLQYFPELRFIANSDHTNFKLRQCHHLIKKFAEEMIQFLDSPPDRRNG